jgi:hypothetical protein
VYKRSDADTAMHVYRWCFVVQEKLEGFIYRSLEQTVRSIVKGAVKSNWYPESAVSEQVSSYMEQLVLMLQVQAPFYVSVALRVQSGLLALSKGCTIQPTCLPV